MSSSKNGLKVHKTDEGDPGITPSSSKGKSSSRVKKSTKPDPDGSSQTATSSKSNSKPEPKPVDPTELAALLRKSADIVERDEFDAILYEALQDFRAYYKLKLPKATTTTTTSSSKRKKKKTPSKTSPAVDSKPSEDVSEMTEESASKSKTATTRRTSGMSPVVATSKAKIVFPGEASMKAEQHHKKKEAKHHHHDDDEKTKQENFQKATDEIYEDLEEEESSNNHKQKQQHSVLKNAFKLPKGRLHMKNVSAGLAAATSKITPHHHRNKGHEDEEKQRREEELANESVWCEEHFTMGCGCKLQHHPTTRSTQDVQERAGTVHEPKEEDDNNDDPPHPNNNTHTHHPEDATAMASKPAFQRPLNPSSPLIANGWIEQHRRSKLQHKWKDVLASLVEGRSPGEETTLWIQREVLANPHTGKKELEALHQIPMKAIEEVQYLEHSVDNRFAVKMYNVPEEFLFKCPDDPDASLNWVVTLRSAVDTAKGKPLRPVVPPPPSLLDDWEPPQDKKRSFEEEEEKKRNDHEPSPFQDVPESAYGAPAAAETTTAPRMKISELRAICHGAGINTAGMERDELEQAAREVQQKGTFFERPSTTTTSTTPAPPASDPLSKTTTAASSQPAAPSTKPATTAADTTSASTSSSSSVKSMSIKELRAICHGAGINTSGMERGELERAAESVQQQGTFFPPRPTPAAPSSGNFPSTAAAAASSSEAPRSASTDDLADLRAKQEAEEQRRRRQMEQEQQQRQQREVEEARQRAAAASEAEFRRQQEAAAETRRRQEEERRRQQQQAAWQQQQAAWQQQQQQAEHQRRMAEQQAAEQRRRQEEAYRRQQQFGGGGYPQQQHHQQQQPPPQGWHPQHQQPPPQQQQQHWQRQPPPQHQQQQQFHHHQQWHQQQQQHQRRPQQPFPGQPPQYAPQQGHAPPPPPPPPPQQQQQRNSAADQKYAKMADQGGSDSITRIKHDILIQWALQPPNMQMLRPIEVLVTSIHGVFPPALGVPGHDYFTKWSPINQADVLDGGRPSDEKLKKAVRKLRFFLHPDKLPRDLNPDQSFMVKMLWDITSDAWEEFHKKNEDLDWIK